MVGCCRSGFALFAAFPPLRLLDQCCGHGLGFGCGLGPVLVLGIGFVDAFCVCLGFFRISGACCIAVLFFFLRLVLVLVAFLVLILLLPSVAALALALFLSALLFLVLVVISVLAPGWVWIMEWVAASVQFLGLPIVLFFLDASVMFLAPHL